MVVLSRWPVIVVTIADYEATANLELTIRNLREERNEKLFYLAGLYYYMIGDLENAKDLIDRMLKIAPPTKEGLLFLLNEVRS